MQYSVKKDNNRFMKKVKYICCIAIMHCDTIMKLTLEDTNAYTEYKSPFSNVKGLKWCKQTFWWHYFGLD